MPCQLVLLGIDLLISVLVFLRAMFAVVNDSNFVGCTQHPYYVAQAFNCCHF